MSPAAVRRFRVLVHDFTTWAIIIEAPDSDTAEDEAIERLSEDIDQFEHVSGGIETIDCVEVQS